MSRGSQSDWEPVVGFESYNLGSVHLEKDDDNVLQDG